MTDSKNYWLKADRVRYLKQALESSGRTEKQFDEDVRILTEWVKTQQHLPEIPSENQIMNTLWLNKYSIEKCKQCLDIYYTIRTLLPEIYDNMDSKAMLKEADKLYFFPLPKKTAEGDQINIIKLLKTNPSDFEMYSSMGYCYNSIDLMLNEDVITTLIIIDDMETLSISHLQKITPVHMKKMVMILEKVYSNRVKQFHIVNCPPFAYTFLTVLKSLFNPKLASRVFLHEDSSKLKEILPPEILPKDYGGSELCLHELNELWKNRIAEYGDRFDKLAKMKTNEKLRPSPLVNDEVLGFHGNFRKLEMD